MNEAIMQNLANWLMLERCKQAGLDPSGSHVEHPRGLKGERVYTLVRDDRPFIQLTLTKSNAPRFTY